MCIATILKDRAVFEVKGADARRFLHGIITNSMEKAREGEALHAGLLTPQGKLLFDFFIYAPPRSNGSQSAAASERPESEEETRFLFDCPEALKDELIKRLTFYRLRAKVDFADLSGDYEVLAVWQTDAAPALEMAFRDPRLPALGWRAFAAKGAAELMDDLPCERGDEAAYHAHRIALGVPEGGKDYAFGDIFPHEANFDQLNGVDFNKGCYVGQEVVSRMQHKTVVRKRIVPVMAVQEGQVLPPFGTEIEVEGFPIGKMGSSTGGHGLALIRLDRAAKALSENKAITANGVALRLKKPDWARFEIPQQAA